MATFSGAIGYHGLQAAATLTGSGVVASGVVGIGQTAMSLPDATTAYSFAVEVDSGGEVAIDLSNGAPTLTGAGMAQTGTATAAGTITVSGDATVTVTSSYVAGSPLVVPVAVLATDTAATWAGKVRAALAALPAITDRYTVSGATTAITLTATTARRNDSPLNIALDNGTCEGITPAPVFSSSSPGVAPSLCYRLPGVAFAPDDIEGAPLPASIGTYYGIHISVEDSDNGVYIATDDGDFKATAVAGQKVEMMAAAGLGGGMETAALEFTPVSAGYSKAVVTLVCAAS